jgi:hypothetical protein
VPQTQGKAKREKRQLSLAGQDPIAVLKRLLATPPRVPATQGQDQPAKQLTAERVHKLLRADLRLILDTGSPVPYAANG